MKRNEEHNYPDEMGKITLEDKKTSWLKRKKKDHILRDISKPEGVREKSRFKKNEATTMRILMDSVKDHLVPLIAS